MPFDRTQYLLISYSFAYRRIPANMATIPKAMIPINNIILNVSRNINQLVAIPQMPTKINTIPIAKFIIFPPRYGSINLNIRLRALLIGIARPMPAKVPDGETMAVLMPMTTPDALIKAPPALPRFRAASVIKRSS